MFTIITDNIFKLWGLSLAKSALNLSDGTTASIVSPQCIYTRRLALVRSKLILV